jgi:hypothetical protein
MMAHRPIGLILAATLAATAQKGYARMAMLRPGMPSHAKLGFGLRVAS